MTSLATVRSDIYSTLYALKAANVYRRRQTDYTYPTFIVGWPQSLDFRPEMGGARDFVIEVVVGVEVTDEDGADDTLSSLIETAVAALQTEAHWDVQPATDFGEELLADGRVVIWCRLPVAVWE